MEKGEKREKANQDNLNLCFLHDLKKLKSQYFISYECAYFEPEGGCTPITWINGASWGRERGKRCILGGNKMRGAVRK